MGPNEQKLAAVRDADPEGLEAKAKEWGDAHRALDDLRDDVEHLRSRARDSWKGSDADAADMAFKAKLATIERAQERMKQTELGIRAGSDALTTAQSRLDGLKPVPASPGAAPSEPGAGADQAAKDKYDAAAKKHGDEVTAHKAAAAERERVAGEALEQLDRNLESADDMLSKAAPKPDDVDSSYDGGDGGPGSSSAGGTSPMPVVGGATAGPAIGLATIGRPGKGKQPGRDDDELPDVKDPSTSSSTVGDGSGPSTMPQQAGQAGGSGIGGAAGAAGALGAGKGILGKLTGGAKGADAATSRTAGMQKGSTLGSRAAGASPGQAGQSAAGSRTAGQSAGSRAGAQSPGQSAGARGAGSRTAGQPAGARGGSGSRTAGQAGGRGGQAGGRSAPTSRTAGQQGGRGSGRARDDRRDEDQKADHLAFDDDQWLDEDETTPGVLR